MRLFILFILSSSTLFAQLPESSIGATINKIESKYLGMEHEVWVNLPNTYDSTKSYPVVYVLDAEWRFDIARALIREMSINDLCPEHIVIGIPQMGWQHRCKNFTFTNCKINALNEPDSSLVWSAENTGGGWNYLSFLEEEVVPYVNSNYSTNGFDVLMGHSLGGYYAAYVMPKTKVFDAFQIYDPSIWYNELDALKHLRNSLSKDIRTNAYVAQGANGFDRDIYFIAAVDSLSALFGEYPGIRTSSSYYEEEYHNSMFMFAVIDGMKFLYDGYEFGFIAPDDDVVAEDYFEHFRKFSEKINFEFSPNADGFRWIGHANYSQGRWHEALKAFEHTDKAYNDSMYLNEVATCHEKVGNAKKAVHYYSRALALDPNNKGLKEKIEGLKKSIEK